MGLFGKLDAANVSANPFYIKQGEYSATVTDARYKENRDGERQLFIEYTIDDPESQYLDFKATQFFTLPDDDLDEAKFALLPAEEKKKVQRNISNMKKALCGNGNNKGLGQEPDDLNDASWDPAVLRGLKVDMAISNFGTDGVNVRWANLQD